MKNKIEYKCKSCNQIYTKWQGQCTACKEWNTIEELQSNTLSKQNTNKKATKLKNITINKETRLITNISEFDRVVGGGIVDDSVTIMSAAPGCGKSTLCLMICEELIKQGKNCLYASGEESNNQIVNRAKRLGLNYINDLWISDNNNLDCVIDEINNNEIDFLILDSIQTFYLNEFLPSKQGNPSQVMACASAIIDICKRNKRPISCIMIGQVTKDDDLAGLKSLEHLVDTYLKMEYLNDDNVRMLKPIKNRYGDVNEIGFFNMTSLGLKCIDNPSEYFIVERTHPIVGTSLTVLKEGSRPIITEIESIVSKSFTPFPSRIGESLKKDQLNTLVSILEQRASINLTEKNVIIKATGGVKLSDPSCNLAILMTIISSYYNISINNKTVFIADVGLTGELKKVPNIEIKLKELDRMGYKKVFIANKSIVNKTIYDNLQIIECEMLIDVINNIKHKI